MNNERLRRLAGFRPTDEQWRVEAHFTHLIMPVIYDTSVKMDAYERIGRMLAASEIEMVLVYKNGVRHQTITVNTSTD